MGLTVMGRVLDVVISTVLGGWEGGKGAVHPRKKKKGCGAPDFLSFAVE